MRDGICRFRPGLQIFYELIILDHLDFQCLTILFLDSYLLSSVFAPPLRDLAQPKRILKRLASLHIFLLRVVTAFSKSREIID